MVLKVISYFLNCFFLNLLIRFSDRSAIAEFQTDTYSGHMTDEVKILLLYMVNSIL